MRISEPGYCSGWLFKSWKSKPQGMSKIQIICGAASSAGNQVCNSPIAIDSELENFTSRRVSGNNSQADIVSAISGAITRELNVGYNDNPLVRSNGEKTALDVFHEEGLDSYGKYRRFALCSEVSYLAVAMLRIAGMDADCAIVSSPPFDSMLFAMPIRHMVAMPNISGKPAFLDLTSGSEVKPPYTTEYCQIKDPIVLLGIHLNNSANMFAVQGRHFPAIETVNRAIDTDPNNGDAWLTKGRILMDKGETKEAEQCLLSSSELGSYFINPRFLCEPFFALGELYFRQNSFINASIAFKRAVRIYPFLMSLIQAQKPEYIRFLQ